MEIVIKIPEHYYKNILKYSDAHTFYPITEELYRAVKSGIPLPKRHGRLIDADELLKNRHEAIPVIHAINAPTIIEAENEETTNSK